MNQALTLETETYRFLDICNRILKLHADEFPYNAVIALLEKLFPQGIVTLRIRGGEGEDDEFFTTRFSDGIFGPLQQGRDPSGRYLSLSRCYMDLSLTNAEFLVAQPNKMEWSWIKVHSGD